MSLFEEGGGAPVIFLLRSAPPCIMTGPYIGAAAERRGLTDH